MAYSRRRNTRKRKSSGTTKITRIVETPRMKRVTRTVTRTVKKMKRKR